ncbi:PQ-loop-domain-containing protein [Metschnikowia bicuspidata var. bicuspidata NRRL YB-4993]|uniref:PQ-loop-domain-containing protein n=1 Tax=Metschnikowia bicuspidata var. bicuspidata NRRL YB-4993 TaxID=869754 RepID=A0A1A0H210_9ASCO|nr:PQ-loop-domain-containing protein [Metschnikowia bicuspidata var. bicuspidata NRRL YB-4993]OBA17990.1 PQ-loop-domain-containing protein [Metschnikowia bicuspidata var. bicuspidata NRRL YB-4993]
MVGCVTSGVSQLFSTLSLISWICAQAPQIFSNYTTKSTEGISPLFLLLWFMGDFLSFTSCLLNDAALSFQIYLSMFFLANDLTLCYQYYYYNSIYPRKYLVQVAKGKSICNDSEALNLTEIYKEAGAINIRHGRTTRKYSPDYSLLLNLGRTSKESIHSPSSSLSSAGISPRGTTGFGAAGTSPKWGKIATAAGTLMNLGVTQAKATGDISGALVLSYKEILGLVLAWGCTCVYVSSRCPQLYKNYLRKSVDGISPLLFGSALLGNLMYTSSVLTSCEFVSSGDRMSFFWKQLPYLLGSSGTIVFDIGYFYQRYIYRNAARDNTEMGLENWVEEY